MKPIESKKWIPADGMTLEANAMEVATKVENNLVVAGPGAGKTELLAQKACFLLQTNTCPFPFKILAISFKKDAAFNLRERVRLRCGDELARRFDSITFDSFAKQLLDRFKQALPVAYKITTEYELILSDEFILDYYKAEDIHFFNTTNRNDILNLHNSRFPHLAGTRGQEIRNVVWKRMLGGKSSNLSFKMIMRLAEYIIYSNPKVKQYLQETYKFVFLDEFQDTTGLQYDLFRTCFSGGENSYTAVGDDKQRIMLWAGAEPEIFTIFSKDVSATQILLTMNFRCAPRLVILLNHLTEHLLLKKDFATPSPKWHKDQGECAVWLFKNPDDEMKILFDAVHSWIENGVNPRDICILVKQQLVRYAGNIIKYFNNNGIKTRDENKFQDLLSQEISMFILNVIYIAFQKRSGEAKGKAFAFLSNLHTEMEDDQLLKLESTFSKFIKKIKTEYNATSLTDEDIQNMIELIVCFAGKDRMRAYFPSYKKIADLNKIITDFSELLCDSYHDSNDIILASDKLTGKDTIPVMTIHKSKGLEYHTVIFVGLEDGAFWTFERQPDEDKCAFFVALSRARERVLFTFSNVREDNQGRMREQQFDTIRILFQELEKSGIVTLEEK